MNDLAWVALATCGLLTIGFSTRYCCTLTFFDPVLRLIGTNAAPPPLAAFYCLEKRIFCCYWFCITCFTACWCRAWLCEFAFWYIEFVPDLFVVVVCCARAKFTEASC